MAVNSRDYLFGNVADKRSYLKSGAGEGVVKFLMFSESETKRAAQERDPWIMYVRVPYFCRMQHKSWVHRLISLS